MLALAACRATEAASAPAARPDPSLEPVDLPARDGWQAALVLDDDVGVWTVEVAKVFSLYGCPEVVGLDDKGRCIVLWSYSGKWTPRQTVEDVEWLGALAVDDLDPRLPGPEVYTGGKRGNLYRIHADGHLTFDTRVIARMPGEELHTAVAGDLDAARAGGELLVFTGRGEAHLVVPDGAPGGGFTQRPLAQLPGRVRQAVRLPEADGAPGRRVAAALRSGEVLLLDLHDGRLAWEVVLEEPMGLGRLALAPFRAGAPTVLYVTRDDGLVLRLERRAGGWVREVVYAGPQGPRGVAAGRFDADPLAETLAVFGYGGRVQLLTRRPGAGWEARTLFEDIDRGHWLAAAELDGRNGTDELLCTGYSGRIVLLARPPGYGLPGMATDPDALLPPPGAQP
jgi:hypothetical protein